MGDYLEYVAPEKTVIALPWYGRRYPTETNEVNSILSTGVTYPYATALCWGQPSAIYAQWRDVAGNWSPVQGPTN